MKSLTKDRVGALLFIIVVLFAAPFAVGAEISLQSKPLLQSSCPNGMSQVLTVPFSDQRFNRHMELRVIADGYKTLPELVTSLRARGLVPRAVINGGFFSQPWILSYFKSAKEGLEHERNSAMSPRACMIHDQKTKLTFSVLSDPLNYEMMKALKDVEIFCAGPQLVKNGLDVSKNQFCVEKFDPACRPNGSDPGIGYFENFPRSGSCVLPNGDLKLFYANSESHHCGLTLPQLTQWMISEGCTEGMNHDGGGSSKFFAEVFPYGAVTSVGSGVSRIRPIPVWVVLVESIL